MTFSPDVNQFYKLVPISAPKLCLDCSQGHNKNEAILWDYKGTANQKYAIRQLPNGKYAFFCGLHNGSMELVGDGNNGSPCVFGQPNNTPSEWWDLVPCGPNMYQIRASNGRHLDVYEGQFQQGTKIIVWDAHQQNNQKW